MVKYFGKSFSYSTVCLQLCCYPAWHAVAKFQKILEVVTSQPLLKSDRELVILSECVNNLPILLKCISFSLSGYFCDSIDTTPFYIFSIDIMLHLFIDAEVLVTHPEDIYSLVIKKS